jgi:L-fucose dehydrogenase
MNLNLAGKVVIVTGGAKGIGLGIAHMLIREGAVPVLVGRNEADNLRALDELLQQGGKAGSTTAELSDPHQCKQAVEAIVQTWGRIDGLINNAGVNDGVGLERGDYESFLLSLHKNLIHYYLMAHHALPWLKLAKGSIVNISSKTADTGQGHTSAYAAANGGRNALTREWAIELAPYDIRVNAVVVAECYTPLYEKWIQTLPNPETVLQQITERIPFQKRFTTVEEIAAMAVFLLSDVSSHTTGQLIHVDGGYVHLDRAV